ncbi:MAG: hypothetical protein LBQ50_12320 [Planctomycetaceae bacterium]|nr:hypothetical protein [Planctomycetaceae bacterium]
MQNIGSFRCVRLDSGGFIPLPNQQDLCPDMLYEKSITINS